MQLNIREIGILIARVCLLIVVLVLAISGTAAPQYRYSLFLTGYNIDYRIYFKRVELLGVSSSIEDTFCGKFAGLLNAGLAFAILCILSVAASLICAGLLFFKFLPTKILGWTSVGFAAFGCVSAILCWTIVVGGFHSELCDYGSSLSQAGMVLNAGPALFIVSWILLMVDVGLGITFTMLSGKEVPASPMMVQAVPAPGAPVNYAYYGNQPAATDMYGNPVAPMMYANPPGATMMYANPPGTTMMYVNPAGGAPMGYGNPNPGMAPTTVVFENAAPAPATNMMGSPVMVYK